MTAGLHLALALGGTVVLWRGALRVAQGAPDDAVAAAFPLAVLIATAFGSIGAIVAGRSAWSPSRALALDAATLGGAAWWLFVLTLGPWTRELGGISLVCIAAARLAPAIVAVASLRAPAWLAFVVALGAYGALAAWLPAASLPFGDQVHYLLGAEQLRRGTLDASLDAQLFTSLVGFAPGSDDVGTHVADTPVGPRPIQGYALQLLLLPGWAMFGRLGAHLTMALVAAWASYQTFLILRDLHRGAGAGARRPAAGPVLPAVVVGGTWIAVSFLAPMSPLATHLYPNMLGAAIVATAFRAGFTAPVPRPALAAAVLALTLFLTPRDGLALAVLLPFLLWQVGDRHQIDAEWHQFDATSPRPSKQQPTPGRRRRLWQLSPARRSAALAAAGVTVAALAINSLLYGLPVPYAGYVFGTAQAQAITQEPSITPRIWIGLPAILFDRTFGLAGTAPWIFIGLLGLVPLLRFERALRRPEPAREGSGPARSPVGLVLAPAALTVGVSVLALSFFRLWEGGYAPPNRYLVDVLPLWAPFVAFGLTIASTRMRVEGPRAEAGPKVPTPPVLDAFKVPTPPVLDAFQVRLALRALLAVVIFASALMTLVLNAIPTTALNAAFDHQVRDAMGRILGVDPLAWLPSFQPTTPDWYVTAYVRLVPALAIAAALVALGAAVASRLRPTSSATPWLSQGQLPRTGIDPMPNGIKLMPKHLALSEAGPVPRTDLAPSTRTELTWSVALNVVALAYVLIAVSQPWVRAGSEPVPESLFLKWLPLALALATAGTLLVARLLTAADRARFLARHYLVYLPALALMLVAHAGAGTVLNAQLGALYLTVGVVFSLNALMALWGPIAGPSAMAGRPAGPLTDRSAALHLAAVALVAFVVLLPYHRAVMPTASDEPHYLLIVQSLLYDGDVDLRNDYEGDRYSAFYPARLPDMHGIEIGRAVYPIRDLGLPILGALPFAIAGRLGVLALMCVVGAALVAQLYLLLRDLRFEPRVAFLAVATTALTHPILTYTTQVYPELLTALVFVSAARLLRAGPRTPARELAVASGLVALLPVLSTRAWPIAVGLGLVVAYAALRPLWAQRKELRAGAVRAAAAALPFIAIVGALSFANWLMFGVFLPSAGYYIIREQQQVLAYAPHVGATGLFFDRVFGLVPRAPVYLLAFLGILALARRARAGHGAEMAALGLGGGLSFLYIANIAYWWADGSPPSRYLLGAIPLFVAAVAGGWEVVLGAAGRIRAPLRWLAWGSVIASVAVAYVYAMQPNTRYDLALDIRASGSSGSLFAFLDQQVGLDPGVWFPSMVGPSVEMAALAAPWLGLAGALVWLGRRGDAVRVHVSSGDPSSTRRSSGASAK